MIVYYIYIILFKIGILNLQRCKTNLKKMIYKNNYNIIIVIKWIYILRLIPKVVFMKQ